VVLRVVGRHEATGEGLYFLFVIDSLGLGTACGEQKGREEKEISHV